MVAARLLPPVLALALLTLGACGGSKRDVAAARVFRGDAAVDEARDPARAAASDAGSAEPSAVDAGPRFGFTLGRWMKEHGVTVPPDVDVCDYEAMMGEPPVPVVVCSTHVDLSGDRVLYRRTIFAAEHGELRRVFDAAIASGQREPSSDPDAGSDLHAVRLEFSMTVDGTITLRDSGDRGCSAAAAAKRRDEAADKVCAGRGVYVWKDGRFARAARAQSAERSN
jgi:hypothetical protein